MNDRNTSDSDSHWRNVQFYKTSAIKLARVCVCVCSYTNVHLFVVFTQYFDITGESREKLFTSLKKFYTHRNFEAKSESQTVEHNYHARNYK